MYDKNYGMAVIPNGTGVLVADDLTAAAAHGQFIAVKKVSVKRLIVTVSTAVVSSGAVVVTFYKQLSAGTTGSQVSMGTVSIPAGSALGKVVIKDIDPVDIFPGQAVAVAVTTAAAGGGAAGGGLYSFEWDPKPEEPANESNVIISA